MDEELSRDVDVHKAHLDVHVQKLIDPKIAFRRGKHHIIEDELLETEDNDTDDGNSEQ